MTLIEHSPTGSEILHFIDDSIQMLRESGESASHILVGREAFADLSTALAERFKRNVGEFESYASIPIVVDPSRTSQVLVLPRAAVAAKAAVVSTV